VSGAETARRVGVSKYVVSRVKTGKAYVAIS